MGKFCFPKILLNILNHFHQFNGNGNIFWMGLRERGKCRNSGFRVQKDGRGSEEHISSASLQTVSADHMMTLSTPSNEAALVKLRSDTCWLGTRGKRSDKHTRGPRRLSFLFPELPAPKLGLQRIVSLWLCLNEGQHISLEAGSAVGGRGFDWLSTAVK